jgi:hypothetical protein
LNDEIEKEEIKDAFLKSKCYRWIVHVLENEDNHEIYFGNLTNKLHGVLVSDPPPYRKDVKILLANLLDWIENLADEEIIVDKPNHSQRIRIK